MGVLAFVSRCMIRAISSIKRVIITGTRWLVAFLIIVHPMGLGFHAGLVSMATVYAIDHALDWGSGQVGVWNDHWFGTGDVRGAADAQETPNQRLYKFPTMEPVYADVPEVWSNHRSRGDTSQFSASRQ
jgi:hypothetical protein